MLQTTEASELLQMAKLLCQQVQDCHQLHGGLLTSECRRTARELTQIIRHAEHQTKKETHE